MIRVSDGKFTYEYASMAELQAALDKKDVSLAEGATVKFTVKIPAPWFLQLIETVKDIGGELV